MTVPRRTLTHRQVYARHGQRIVAATVTRDDGGARVTLTDAAGRKARVLRKALAGVAAPMADADVCPGDQVYFRGSAGEPVAGRVLCCGAHGAVVDAETGRCRVRYADILGHKQRGTRAYTVADEGEDGVILDGAGGKIFVKRGNPMNKAKVRGPLLFLKARRAVKGGKNVLKTVTDKKGNTVHRWMKTGMETPAPGKQGHSDDDGPRGSKMGYGTHLVDKGDKVRFDIGKGEATGRVLEAGKDGATVKTKDGHEAHVRWDQIRAPQNSAKEKAKVKQQAGYHGMTHEVPAKDFSAAAHYRSTADEPVTPDQLRDELSPDQFAKIEAVQERLVEIEKTIDRFRKTNGYIPAREKIHNKIIYGSDERKEDGSLKYPGILTPTKIAAATPRDGQKPTATFLGGRGGSGKSALNGLVYDEDHAIVLDADAIKALLPEYEGWNAHQVHDESSDVLAKVRDQAKQLGLNIVIDATMKTPEKAIKQVERLKADGYRIEAHFMHLPRHEAARRALQRFFGKSGRFVPPEVIFANRHNEEAFDAIRSKVDKWSFWDNTGGKGSAPRLVSHSEA